MLVGSPGREGHPSQSNATVRGCRRMNRQACADYARPSPWVPRITSSS